MLYTNNFKDVLTLGVHNPAYRLHRHDLLRSAHRHNYRRRLRENLRVSRLYLSLIYLFTFLSQPLFLSLYLTVYLSQLLSFSIYLSPSAMFLIWPLK